MHRATLLIGFCLSAVAAHAQYPTYNSNTNTVQTLPTQAPYQIPQDNFQRPNVLPNTNNTGILPPPTYIQSTTGAGQTPYQTTYQPDRQWDLTLGLGLRYGPEYSGAEDYEASVMPLLLAEYRYNDVSRFKFAGTAASYELDFMPAWTAGLKANYRFGRESSDSRKLTGLPDVDGTLEVGPTLRYHVTELLSVGGEVLFDALGEHEGWALDLNLAYQDQAAHTPRLRYGYTFGLEYGSEDFMRTYYSATTNTLAQRTAYTADAGLESVYGAAHMMYAYTPNWFVRGDVQVKQLLGEASDSSLTESAMQPSLILSVGYRF